MACCWLMPRLAMAQGAGPNTNVLTPVGLKTLTLNTQGINSNFRFGQTLIGSARFDTNSHSVGYAQRFRWMDRFAMFGVAASYLNIDAYLQARLANSGESASLVARQAGRGDPSAYLRLGLVGAPALGFEDWLQHRQGFQLYAQVGAQAPWGSYSPNRLLNTGYNRWSWDISLPMAMPLERAKHRTFLEITPRLVRYGDNRNPPGATALKSQSSLFLLEADVLHHLTGKTWVAIGAQYQQGGETRSDGEPDGNGVEQWYGELTLGYAINRQVALNVKWGKLFEVSNDARGEALRLSLVLIL